MSGRVRAAMLLGSIALTAVLCTPTTGAWAHDESFLSGDRLLMPTREGQPPPDLRKFEQ